MKFIKNIIKRKFHQQVFIGLCREKILLNIDASKMILLDDFIKFSTNYKINFRIINVTVLILYKAKMKNEEVPKRKMNK